MVPESFVALFVAGLALVAVEVKASSSLTLTKTPIFEQNSKLIGLYKYFKIHLFN